MTFGTSSRSASVARRSITTPSSGALGKALAAIGSPDANAAGLAGLVERLVKQGHVALGGVDQIAKIEQRRIACLNAGRDRRQIAFPRQHRGRGHSRAFVQLQSAPLSHWTDRRPFGLPA